MKKLLLLVVMCFSFLWNVNSQTTITVGTGTATTSNAPVYGNYGYSYSQILYLGSEISTAGGGTGTISKIRFKLSTAPGDASKSNNWTVYLGNTGLVSLTAGPTNYLATTAMSQVFSGIVRNNTSLCIFIYRRQPYCCS
jgi:hypothetical protein